ncbi:MAG: hypothetical protein JSW36_08960 [Burkholderiales bacterium]|nr:MAG: hypothetical protein JSW36_08960 [Burkholderiales bacterium]
MRFIEMSSGLGVLGFWVLARRRRKACLNGTTPCVQPGQVATKRPAAPQSAWRLRKTCDYSKNWPLPSNFDEFGLHRKRRLA